MSSAPAQQQPLPPTTPEMEILLRRVERERHARKQAEQLLENKSLELYEADLRSLLTASKVMISFCLP